MIKSVSGKPGEGMGLNSGITLRRVVRFVASNWWFPFLVGLISGVLLVTYGEVQMAQMLGNTFYQAFHDAIQACRGGQ